ncbi:MAG: helix-turn-helix transcriptional regulator [Syntrophales bacterium]|nr:helix-turn-helix transcriptional regulator [Syntrophales bacterium]
MLEPTKELTTAAYAEICIRVPAAHAEKVKAVLADILALFEGTLSIGGEEENDRLYSVEEVFPNFHAGDILRGFRAREEMTQAELAAKGGVKASTISEMERGKRPIGKEMARRFAKALNTSYKVFL